MTCIAAYLITNLLHFGSLEPLNARPLLSSGFSKVQGLPRRGALGVSFAPLPADQGTKFGLKAGEGLKVVKTLPGLTGEKVGLRADDLILSLNGNPVVAAKIGADVRSIYGGQPVSFKIVRDGKTMDLSGAMVEKPRDPGNANYEVIYSEVLSNGKRMRTILTKPKTPGKHPALYFIQGFSPISYDFTLETSTGDVSSLDGPILFDFANSGYVTMRVEKPGVGDSEGGPFVDMDYTTELDIYRQALKQLKEQEDVDKDNVFIFGHSMGGAFGPMVACENPVRGLAIYGAAARTWFEYLLDTMRYQGLVAGDTFENADELMRQGSRMMALIFLEGQSPAKVKEAHPEMAKLVDEFFPGGLFNGKSLDFWRQLTQTNFAAYWSKCNAHVLAVRGASDFVTYDADHKLMADIVNKVHPGWGTFAIAPSSDHLFHNFATEPESLKNFQKGKFNPAFIKMMKDWIEGVMKEPLSR